MSRLTLPHFLRMIQPKMTLQEVKDWCKGTLVVDYEDDSYDDNGNHYETKIYKKDGKLWRLSFSNGHPYEKYVKGKGYVRGEYVAPVEVFKKTRTVVQEYYETKEEQDTALQIEALQPPRFILEGRGTEISKDSTVGGHAHNT